MIHEYTLPLNLKQNKIAQEEEFQFLTYTNMNTSSTWKSWHEQIKLIIAMQ